MIVSREIGPGDSHLLVSLDRKFSEFPYDIQDWQLIRNFFQDWWVDILMDGDEIVGFVITEFSEKVGLVIHRMAGDLDAALERVEERAREGMITVLQYEVPECCCRGAGDPYDVSAWLLSNGFRCEDTKKEEFEAYGNLVDVYVFRKRGIE